MNLKDLQVGIPYKWKIQTFSKNNPKAQCVAYIDARDVMKILDFVVGPENWQDDYKMVGNRWMAGIGIRVEEPFLTSLSFDQFQPTKKTSWVWKWDTGNAGNFEEDKSEVSDSFKRAAVKWGIGRFLYDLGFEWVDTNKVGSGAYPIYPHNQERIWDLTEYINAQQKHQKRIEKYKQQMRNISKTK